MSGGGH
ncbi:hypothetical protein TIFTF001_051638 [Ficus carica]|nr:hypothetical protein TIFTF001_051623 [Ficus carica]GMN27939.1 hypothetical protein TIFTF001_051624 [Ficus carica]GMN28039.1 hypothetical protein TIFTF001_051637 [Ficus carica]GMN28050.1 hypothetical protein TIFTF001_051638 [Ficus carica]